MKLKLDAKTVAGLALTKGRDEEFAWDLEVPNFGLRLRRSGDGVQRTYVAQYRAGGRTRRVRLGVAEHLSPTQAREAARKVLAKVALGGDPQAEKQAKKAEAGQTFTAMVEKYLEAKQPDLRKVSFRLTKLYLLGPYFRSLHSMGVAAITRDHIADRLTVITKRHSAYTAATAQRHLSTFFRWLMEEGWVAANPVIRTPKPKKAKARERVLDDGELVAVWNATGGDNDHDRIVRLQILTGARRALAHDCGQIINPDGLRNQIDGNVIQTMSRTLIEEIKYDRSSVTSLDWATYPILRFPQIPEIVYDLIDRPNERPWGAGEPSAAVVPSAISNAVFDAIGVRLRSVPFTPDKVKAAMKGAA